MSNYIYIKNFYLNDLKAITQKYIASNYENQLDLKVEIWMKNSRTFFIKFNEDLAFEEIIDWMNHYKKNHNENERVTHIEAYQLIKDIGYKYYYENSELFAINTNQQIFKVEHNEKLVELEYNSITFTANDFPTKNIHLMEVLQFELPKKKWWKLW